MVTVLGEELPSRCGDGNRVFEMRGVVGGVGGVLGLNVPARKSYLVSYLRTFHVRLSDVRSFMFIHDLTNLS